MALSTIGPVAPSRVWSLNEPDKGVASEVVVLPAGGSPVLAMDFSRILNPETSLEDVLSVTDELGAGLTIGTMTLSLDRRKAHIVVSNLVAGAKHLVKVRVSTSDTQKLVGKGHLHVE